MEKAVRGIPVYTVIAAHLLAPKIWLWETFFESSENVLKYSLNKKLTSLGTQQRLL